MHLNIINPDTENTDSHTAVNKNLNDEKYTIELTVKRCSNLYVI